MKECAVILIVALIGGLMPLLARWTDRLLHLALSLSTGVFLGAVFLHLLPALATMQNLGQDEPRPAPPVTEAVESEQPAGNETEHGAEHETGARDGDDLAHAGHAHGEGLLTIWFFVLVGVLAVYLAEALVFHTHDHDDVKTHRAVGFAALFGLSIHALTAGLGYSAAALQEGLAVPVFISLTAHKAFEAFSLASVFLLAQFRRGLIIVIMVLFSMITPGGILLGGLLTSQLNDYGVAVVTALAAGSFLYVCLCELLPEVFHRHEDRLAKIVLMAAGIGSMVLFHGMGA